MTPTRYSYGAIALHWAIALALAFQISLGWTLDGPESVELFNRYQVHKSLGITILVLSLIRLGWRFAAPRPSPSEEGWTRWLASAVHWLFYVVMIAGPITGWIMVSTSEIRVPTLIWGTIPLPHLPLGEGWNDPAENIHAMLAWLAVGLFALHVAGALRHQWLLGKPELQRMIPFARGKAVVPALGVLALILAALFAAKMVSPDRSASPQVEAEAATAAETSDAPEIEGEAIANEVSNEVAPPEEAEEIDLAEEAAPLSAWSVNPGGRLGFTASWNGQAVNGSFDRWTATIRFSPDQLDRSDIRVTVDLASVGTGDGQRDTSLKGADFFATGTHPSATFTSQNIRHLGGDRYEARGTLDLRGASRPLTLVFTLRIEGNRATVSGSSRLDRTAFGVGQGNWSSTDAIAANVDVNFAFTASRAGP